MTPSTYLASFFARYLHLTPAERLAVWASNPFNPPMEQVLKAAKEKAQ